MLLIDWLGCKNWPLGLIGCEDNFKFSKNWQMSPVTESWDGILVVATELKGFILPENEAF